MSDVADRSNTIVNADPDSPNCSTFQSFFRMLNLWDSALATFIMDIIPIIIFFLVLQNYIIKGITAGSVKS